MKLSQLLAPAIQYAEEGFPVSEIIAGFWKSGERIAARYPEAAATYYPNGRAPRMGELFHNPNLATSLRTVAEGGRDAYYRGPIARQIVAFSQSHGGYFSLKDFEDHTSNVGRAGLDQLPRLRRVGASPQRTGDRRPRDPQHSRRVRSAFDGTAQSRLSAPVHRGQETRLRRPGQVLSPTRPFTSFPWPS